MPGPRSGPLSGLRVLEFAGIGPAPFCGMLLADMGADVLLVDRPAPATNTGTPHPLDSLSDGPQAVCNRGKRSLVLDLKRPEAVEAALALASQASVLIEGLRPGVMERLGLGPEPCLQRNPALVYGRMTGWGQSGPLAHAAGHDLNYAALSGALRIGQHPDGPPWAPPTLVGDMGGGGMLLAFGLVCAVLEARQSGKGQVVDAAITDGAALLTSLLWGMRAGGAWRDGGPNLLDGAMPFYDVYRCADGGWISVGALEPRFYAELLDRLGLDDFDATRQLSPAEWPRLRERLRRLFAGHDRAHWCALLEGSDVCFAPVLDMGEAPDHPHNAARGTFTSMAGVAQPAPAPRFSRTPASIGSPPPHRGEHSCSAARDWGLGDAEVERLLATGALRGR